MRAIWPLLVGGDGSSTVITYILTKGTQNILLPEHSDKLSRQKAMLWSERRAVMGQRRRGGTRGNHDAKEAARRERGNRDTKEGRGGTRSNHDTKEAERRDNIGQRRRST
ncbi:hypothetical protein J6590_030517 [Homalodisca vitripennis]|nr:hypothetical protein J6590_030517 [Homalodisca vitripennis]